MTRSRARLLSWAALLVGVVLMAVTIWLLDIRVIRAEATRLGAALPLVLLASGAWHLARTVAWAACFPPHAGIPFWRLARVRLAAEAFSYVTLRGIAGEPLKVLLLDREADPRDATAAVALERMAFLAVTTIVVGIAALYVMATLPLTRAWFRVFRAFAICAAVVVVLSTIVISGRRTYLGFLESRWGRAGRFIAAVERQLLEVLRHNPKRLAIVIIMNVAAYAAMVLEVWIVLRAAGAGAGFDGALAVETFSRVAGFASTLIPANLGALEASSVAAVAAIGASSGGAALAVARRIRGIFWAVAGMLVYPRPSARGNGVGALLLYVAPLEAADASIFGRVAGLAIAERVFRAARRAGCDRVRLLAPGREETLEALARKAGLELDGPKAPADSVRRRSEVPRSGTAERQRAGVGPREQGMMPAEHRIIVEHGWIPRPGGGGFETLDTRVLGRADLPIAEREIRAAVFKSTDRNLAVFNRRMSLPISIALLRTPITANQFSVGLLLLGLWSAWLFSRGSYLTGLLAALVSLAASILDGCDGEIARLKYQESAFGCWLETVTDYVYYFAIFTGMTAGVARATGWDGMYWAGGLALGGMALSFTLLLYLRQRLTAGSPEKFSSVARRRFDDGGAAWTRWLARLSSTATRAQMPYGILALALVNALPLVVVLCAIGANLYWIALALRLRALLDEQPRIAPPAMT